jgi:hypothetical protein
VSSFSISRLVSAFGNRCHRRGSDKFSAGLREINFSFSAKRKNARNAAISRYTLSLLSRRGESFGSFASVRSRSNCRNPIRCDSSTSFQSVNPCFSAQATNFPSNAA